MSLVRSSTAFNRVLIVSAGIVIAILLTLVASKSIKEPFECWTSSENGQMSPKGGIMTVFFTNAKTTVPAGTDTQVTGWSPSANYFSPSMKSYTPANFLNSTNAITFPVSGLYTINFSTRFANATASIQNALWLVSINGTYGSGPISSTTTRLSQSEGVGLVDGNVSFTGYFNTTDVVQPYVWSSVANNIGGAYGGSSLSISLVAS